ncbi:MAG TPA: hypothetical protein DCK76_11210 [Desulfotomaculum sp.]|nr:MAG: Uncharacterized protein XD78_2244 [Desulfotomaculum sp. 46_296]HAG11915.1 hypothetical protein [Desulfotomaculum sp.]HBY04354.1 hypothetical protein [Desulfotomaculum sp.]
MSETKNKQASTLARLRNIAREKDIEFNSILNQYMRERFLYRLSISDFADKFLLKGGLLLFSYDKFNTRPTIDIDLLAVRIQNNQDILAKAISEIARIQCDDGLIFHVDGIKINTIIEHGQYTGLRANITCNLGRAKNRLKIDIGFGDIVIRPKDIEFPVLLKTNQVPVIKVYSLESSIAEKFEAMVKLSLLNSRMKDFYDIYNLSKSKDFEGRVLQEAIFQTFQRRKTTLEKEQSIFQDLFINSAEKQREWSNYIRRIRVSSPEYFKDMMNQLILFLKPVYDSLCNEEEFILYWSSINNEWSKKSHHTD